MQFENVITVEQQTSAEGAAAAAEARAQAQQDAQRIRDEIRQRVRDEARRASEEAARVRVELGQGGQTVIVPAPPAPWERNQIPPQAVDIVTMFFIAVVVIIVGLPIARAFGRWIDRRGIPAPVNAELAAQMNRIEQAVDTMSIEIERISEAQRFQAKLLTADLESGVRSQGSGGVR